LREIAVDYSQIGQTMKQFIGSNEGTALKFGAALSHVVANKSACLLQDPVDGRYFIMSKLEQDDQGNTSCSFSTTQLTVLLTEQKFSHDDYLLYLANNINPSEFGQSSPASLHHLNNFRRIQSLRINILPSPLLQEESGLSILKPQHQALFHSKGGIVELLVMPRSAWAFEAHMEEYQYWRDIQLTCRLFDIDYSNITARLETPCLFKNGYLDTVELKVDANVLEAGRYFFQVEFRDSMGLPGESSKLFLDASLLMLYTPRLKYAYPSYLDVDKMLAEGAVYFLVGDSFQGLKELQGFLMCVLTVLIY